MQHVVFDAGAEQGHETALRLVAELHLLSAFFCIAVSASCAAGVLVVAERRWWGGNNRMVAPAACLPVCSKVMTPLWLPVASRPELSQAIAATPPANSLAVMQHTTISAAHTVCCLIW